MWKYFFNSVGPRPLQRQISIILKNICLKLWKKLQENWPQKTHIHIYVRFIMFNYPMRLSITESCLHTQRHTCCIYFWNFLQPLPWKKKEIDCKARGAVMSFSVFSFLANSWIVIRVRVLPKRRAERMNGYTYETHSSNRGQRTRLQRQTLRTHLLHW